MQIMLCFAGWPHLSIFHVLKARTIFVKRRSRKWYAVGHQFQIERIYIVENQPNKRTHTTRGGRHTQTSRQSEITRKKSNCKQFKLFTCENLFILNFIAQIFYTRSVNVIRKIRHDLHKSLCARSWVCVRFHKMWIYFRVQFVLTTLFVELEHLT